MHVDHVVYHGFAETIQQAGASDSIGFILSCLLSGAGRGQTAAIAAEDFGRTALGIFRRGDRFIGKTVSIAGDHLTGAEFANAFSKAFGEEVAYRPYTHDQFRSFSFPFAIEIANTFQYYVEAADYFTGARDLKVVRELNPQLQSFEAWLAAHKDAIRPK